MKFILYMTFWDKRIKRKTLKEISMVSPELMIKSEKERMGRQRNSGDIYNINIDNRGSSSTVGPYSPIDNSKTTNKSLQRKEPWYKKVHPIIAIIVSVITIFIFITGIKTCKELFNKAVEPVTSQPVITQVIQPSFANNLNPDQLLQKRALEIIQSFQNSKDKQIKIESITWLDFSGSGHKTEFYAIYTTPNMDHIVDLYTLKFQSPQRLFHNRDSYLDVTHAVYDKIPFFVCAWSGQGSGGYLNIVLYKWDGVGPISKEYISPESIFQGNVWVIDGKVYISGNNQKYVLIQKDSKFILQKYRARLRYPDHGSASHVLSYHISTEGLKIGFDNRILKFKKIDENEYKCIEPLIINTNDDVMIDDNIEEPHQIRLLTFGEDSMSGSSGFFFSLKPTRSGNNILRINYDYSIWYELVLTADDNFITGLEIPTAE